jgi:hypothetical protein
MIEETYFSNMACSSVYGGSTMSLAVCLCVRRAWCHHCHRSQPAGRDLRLRFIFFVPQRFGGATCIESLWFESNTQ